MHYTYSQNWFTSSRDKKNKDRRNSEGYKYWKEKQEPLFIKYLTDKNKRKPCKKNLKKLLT